MRFVLAALMIFLTLTGCTSVNIIDANPDNPADILKSEMSGLSPSQTNTNGDWQKTLEYINKKLIYGEKIFYSTTFKKFVHARFSNEYKLFELSMLDMESASIQRLGSGNKKGKNNSRINIQAKSASGEFEHIFASGKQSTSSYLLLKIDLASDSIKVKRALELMANPENSTIQ